MPPPARPTPAPALSVVMPVRDALPHLDAAVASILAQSFTDFEFVILDDASSDGSSAALAGWAARDARIRLVRSDDRLGPVGSSNRVVAEARAEIVARMDADDIARDDRLERQAALLKRHPDAVLAGSLWDVVGEDGALLRPADRARLFARTGFAPFVHPTIMFRKSAFDRVGGYRPGTEHWEDIDLYDRLAEAGRMLVIAEPLVTVRLSATSNRRREGAERLEQALDRMGRRGGNTGGSAKLLPASFVAAASPVLWAGRRPKVLGRLLKRGALGFGKASAAALAWSAWADASPRSLRFFLRRLLDWRNWRADRRLRGRQWVEWRSGG